jgi:3-hydroxyisobutyrate dehydrogenase
MARRLIGAGYPVVVYNRSRARTEGFPTVASTPREAAARADVVISMLADDAASRSAWLGDDGALAGARPGTVLIESSTLSVPWALDLAGRGFPFLDAPVTGSKPQAHAGELLFLVGGEAAVLDSVRDALAPMSRGVVHLGPHGSGALMKLVNNFLCGVQAASLAEAMAVIERAGLDRDQALDILSNGAPGSPLLRNLSKRMVAREYSPNFALKLMAKDLSYAIAEGRRHGLPIETAQAALGLFRGAVEKGLGEQDLSAVVESLR